MRQFPLHSFTALAAFLLTSACAWSQSVTLPPEVKGDPGAWVVVVPTAKDGGEVKWKVGPGLTLVPIDKLFPGQKAAGIVVQAPKGTYEVWAWVAKGDVASDLATCKVVIGGPIPGPTPPDPPGPTPPIPAGGMRVLILEETADRSKLPPAQLSVLFDKRVRDYLDSKTPLGSDGKTHEWGIYDQHTDLSGVGAMWEELRKRPHASLPWIIVTSEGKVVHEGALPANTDETLALLKRFGG